MKRIIHQITGIFLGIILAASVCACRNNQEKQFDPMSDAYRALWNPDVQARIDRDIDMYRKADARLLVSDIPAGTEVKVEQISHEFFFGANIFNFNQLGTTERNRKYKELFGTLFNSATVPFYWKKFEMEPGHLRFREEDRDTESYWNQVEEPYKEPHWRRPATDPVVEFCEEKGIRIHGHPIIWGIRTWHHPEWMFEQFCPEEEKQKLYAYSKEELQELPASRLDSLAPVYYREMSRLFEQRVLDLAAHYGDRIQSWDVVNESSKDFHGKSCTGEAVCQSVYGLMPGDYPLAAFRTARSVFPEKVLLNINDYMNDTNYVNQAKDLMAQGCRIDVIGSQMHLFDPQQCVDISEGELIESPQQVWDKMAILSGADLPIHLSEITITAPGDDARGREIQATIARNLYRLWFSIESMTGITWWNVVDNCGAPGEPSTSGIFTRDMEAKPSFYALDKLINHEWKTSTTVIAGEGGDIRFRGFKGTYRLSWENSEGEKISKEYTLSANEGTSGSIPVSH